MKFQPSFSGRMVLEITSAEPERLFQKINIAKTQVFCVQKISDLTYRFQIQRKDYQTVVPLVGKQGGTLRVIGRQGIYWKLRSILHRPIMILGFLLLLLLSYYLPSKVMIIEVNGNETIPDSLILEAAEMCGVSFFTQRQEIRSEKVKNQLLSLIPQLQWAGINTYGSRAVISVREKTVLEEAQDCNIVSNLVADRDGYIIEQTVTSGTPLVQPGDSVRSGQILISGYTDCDFCIQATRASGEILAQTHRDLLSVMPANRQNFSGESENYYQVSLLLRKKRINLWKDSRISDACCGRMYEEYFVPLPGGYRLPLAVCIDRYVFCAIEDDWVQETDAYQMLQSFSDDYLRKLMNTGTILDKQQIWKKTEERYSLNSRYLCTEFIGKEQQEQIGVQHGERD